jgi:hypothetical protein
MEPNRDSQWLHKMADAEDNANVCVGPPAPVDILEEIEKQFPADMGIYPIDDNDPMVEKDPEKLKAFSDALDKSSAELTAAVGPEILAEVDKAVEESGQKKVPELSGDEKLRLLNRAKKMREKAERFGKLHFATKPGEIIAMSDRHYQVAPDGSFRFVRMLENVSSDRPVPNNV